MDFVPLCANWPFTLTCNVTGASPTVTGAALAAASEYYWAKSGHQFGSCNVVIRPCRASCPSAGAWPYWSGASWPWMGPTHGGWYVGWVCNRCGGDSCSCDVIDEVRLPVHAQSITDVVVDGMMLPSTAWRLRDDGGALWRVDGGLWPTCQDWSIPVSGAGAWSIRATFGWPVPTLGKLAVGELICEFTKAIQPAVGECKLPANIVRQVRGNSTFEFATAADLEKLDLTGLPLGDRFLDAYNPHARNESGEPMGRLRIPTRIWNPDDF